MASCECGDPAGMGWFALVVACLASSRLLSIAVFTEMHSQSITAAP
jgi:hypothetical protein